MAIAYAQITIRDENDIDIGAVAPSNPIKDQLWLDTSVKPSQLKKWSGTTWEVVNDTGDIKDDIENIREITNTNVTAISTAQGQISSLIQDTTIVKEGQNIKLKDAYSSTVQTVDSMKITIGQHKSEINDLNSKVATQGTSIQQLQDKIVLKVEKSDITTAINNLNINSRNLIIGSTKDFKILKMTVWNSLYYRKRISELGLKVGDEITYHVYIKLGDVLAKVASRITFYNSEGTNIKTYSNGYININSEGYSYVTCEIPNGAVELHIGFQRHNADGTGNAYTFEYKEDILTKGNKPIAWTPAVEDIEQKITQTNSLLSTVTNDLEGVTSKVSAIESVQTTINGNVATLQSKITDVESKITNTAITNIVKESFYTKEDINSKGYQTESQVQQTINVFELKFQESGGYNLVYNSDFKNGDHLWSISSGAKYYFGTGNWNSPTGLGMAITGQSGTSLYAVQELTNTSYRQAKTFTLSGLVNISSTGTNDSTGAKFQLYVRVTYDDDTKKYHMCNINENSLNKWQKVFVTFDLDTTKKVTDFRTTISIQNTTKTIFVSQIMLEVGSMMSPWSPNSSEVYDGVTTIDKEGITVTASNVKSKTNISATGFKITKTDTNEDVFKVNSNGRLLLDGEFTAHNGTRKSGYFGLDSIKFYNWWADTNEEIANIYGGKDSSNRRSANMVGRDTVALGIGTASSGSKVLESTSSKLSIYKDTDFGGGALTNVRKLNYDVTYDTWINRLYIRSNQINTNMPSGYMHLNYWKGSGTTSTSTHVKIGNGNNDDANGALTCGNFKATGTKNCIVQTTVGYVGINAYETAECYFGDIGTTILDDEGYSFVYIDNIFTETVNTNINYHVFLSVYGDGLARVVKRTPTYFIIKGTANIEVGYEIKAKRKGYEDYRLEREVNNWRIGENHGLDEEYQYERNNFDDSIKQAVQENIKLNTNISQDSLNDLINRTIKDATENKNLIESIEVNLIENTN